MLAGKAGLEPESQEPESCVLPIRRFANNFEWKSSPNRSPFRFYPANSITVAPEPLKFGGSRWIRTTCHIGNGATIRRQTYLALLATSKLVYDFLTMLTLGEDLSTVSISLSSSELSRCSLIKSYFVDHT